MPATLSDPALLERLVAFDSTSRNSNRPIAAFIAEYLDRPGVRIRENPSADGTKVNLVIGAGPEPGDRTGLALSGHMDVVPADEPDWDSDPFALTARDDRYVGRGTADMKGFLALAMNRLAACDPARLRHPLVLLFTYDEELGTLGARRFAESWGDRDALPRDVVIGEPTSLRVVRAHKGYLKLRVTFTGVAAHSGYPHLGRSAIEPAARAIGALAGLREALERERPAHHELFPDVPYPALNVGTVAGGSALNVVPDRCVIQLGIRLLPDMAADAMTDLVRDAVRRGAGPDHWSLESLGESPAMLLPADAPLLEDVNAIAGATASHAVSFATDAGWLQTMGCHCVIWGPGAIEVAHKPNEFLPADEFARAAGLLEALVTRRCLEAA